MHGSLILPRRRLIYSKRPKATTWLGRQSVAGSGATATFTSAISSVAYDRYILAFAFGVANSAGAFSSATIAGVSATGVQSVNNGNTSGGAFVAFLPAGSSGNVVVNWAGSHENSFLWLFEITGISSGTPVGTGSATTNTSVSVTTVASGFLFGAAANNVNNGTFAWTNITEDDDFVGGAQHPSSCAHIATSGSSVSATCTGSGTTQLCVLYVSF